MKNNINALTQDVQLEKQTIGENSKEVIMRHLNSFLDNNLDALLSDYTNESVLIISAFFVDFSLNFPKEESHFVLDKVVANNDLVYILWHAKTSRLQVPIGSDTFIIKDGKIYQQTFVGQLNFINQ